MTPFPRVTTSLPATLFLRLLFAVYLFLSIEHYLLRIVYEIIDNILVVKIVAVGKREDMEVYKKAQKKKISRCTQLSVATYSVIASVSLV
jgi:hypothetical protein